jgi:hypothetical protein
MGSFISKLLWGEEPKVVNIEPPASILNTSTQIKPITEELRYRNDLIDFRIEKNSFRDRESVFITYTHLQDDQYYDYDGSSSGAWFGIFPKSAGIGEWSIWQYVGPGQEEQTLELTIVANGEVGEWEVRFYKDGGNESIAGKLPIFVEGESYDPISLTLDTHEVTEGDVLNVKFAIDPRAELAHSRLVYYSKGTPSIYSCTQLYMLDSYNATSVIPVAIESTGASGLHEIRCFANSSSYTPCLRVPFYINSRNPVKLECYPRNIKDGAILTVEWDMPTHDPDAFLCFYPEDELVEENGFRYKCETKSGIAQVRIESGQRSTGKWAVRLVKTSLLVLAAAPFRIVGAKEAFSEKMLENVKFMDINIVTLS